MKKIKLFENFNADDEILWIFDFDDTLVESPRFEDLIIPIIKENVTIKSMLMKSLKLIDREVKDLKIENGRVFIPDPNCQIIVQGNWVRKKSRVYLISPDRFYFTDYSFPTKVKELHNLYNSVKNKSIVTARSKMVQNKVEKALDDFGMDRPNFGLYCYPSKESDINKSSIWKAKVIVELVKKYGFKKVKFYDDKSKVLSKVKKAMMENLPNVDFEAIKVY